MEEKGSMKRERGNIVKIEFREVCYKNANWFKFLEL